MIACATIVGNGRVLLVRHSGHQKPDYGLWLLPAGKAETGEEIEEALRREIREELGIEIEIIRKLAEHTDPYTGDRLANLLCNPLSTDIDISSELAEARWFSLDEIKKIEKIHAGLKQFLTKGLESGFWAVKE